MLSELSQAQGTMITHMWNKNNKSKQKKKNLEKQKSCLYRLGKRIVGSKGWSHLGRD